jgi:nuclear transport factor 2 (NTF2) superfamily protein
MSRPPFPPFTRETAAQKARMAEDAWNSRDPVKVSLAYTEDSTGAIAASSFRGARRSSNSSPVNGRRSTNIG